jgi:hypothetical protein
MPENESFPSGDTGGSTAVADSPPAQPSTAASSAGASDQPVDGDQSAQPGPIPYERFKQVNEGYQKLRWAEQYDPSIVEQRQRFFQWLDTDPVGAHNYLTDYLTRAGALQQQQAQQPNDGRPQPDVVVPETGQKFYSAEAAEKLAKWQAEQLINERVGPLERSLQQVEADRYTERARAQARSAILEAETWPYYKDHEGEILKAMEADKRLSLEGAYRRVVLPNIRTLERKAVLAEMNQKPSASTVNPGSKSAASRQDLTKKSWGELLRMELGKQK